MNAPTCRAELPGWELAWARLEVTGGGEAELAARRARVAAELAARWTPAELGEDATVVALRRLFKAAGTDPARYRPSSEALLRRLLKGEALPAIHPLVDLNNQLSIELKVPSCVMRDGAFASPVTLRAGRAGEILDSLRGPLDLAGKPLLADVGGPFGTPITDSHRVKVLPETTAGWLVAYLPAGVVGGGEASERLDAILAEAPVARRL
ncbi:MAG: phenylalanine--tRNA ligase beta subunit-related protein [Thermoanaerobaculia bacterium]|nr:phenylalanine--tRNA ligase beta subunit-related protein [Thermoanaerobaculia bacterium]